MTYRSSMEDKKFDEIIRRLSLEAEMSDVPDVWDGIENRLARRRRVILWRRTAVSAAIAAALALAFFLPEREVTETVSVVEPEYIAGTAGMQRENSSAPVADSLDDGVAGPVKEMTSGQVTAGPANLMAERKPSAVQVLRTEDAGMAEDVETVEIVKPAEDTIATLAEKPSSTKEISEGYDSADLLAFSEENSEKTKDVSLSVSSDFYTIYGTGNVNFVSRSMSGGTGGAGGANVKPLTGSSPSHSIPLSAGVEVQYGFGKKNSFGQYRMGMGIGVNYTYMRSSYQALVSRNYLGKYGVGDEQASVTQGLQYIGIPFSLYMNILTTDKLFFYAAVGGEVEKGLQLKYRFVDNNGTVSRKAESVSGVQWSANVGMGLEYRFVNFMGVYVDPRLTYFFNCAQPYSIREEQRLQLNLNLGFRFHF